MILNLKLIKKFDWALIIPMLLLMGLGSLAIFSATAAGKAPGSQAAFLDRQLASIFIGCALFFLFSLINYRILKKISLPIFIFIVIMLVLVLTFGSNINGATSWFRFGARGFQPVELVKLAMIIVLANFFSRNFRRLNEFKYIAASFAIMFIPLILILLQPDPGSAFVILCIWSGLILAAGIRKTHVAILIAFAVMGGIFGWKFALKDYQKARVTTFISPYMDPKGRGYNAIQSVIAVGSGGFWGKGVGNGSQGRLNFLPERHTDFIFANIAEELGFFGVSFLFILYAILLWRLIAIALKANDNFARFAVIGITFMIFTHIVENVGMNIGVMPITGIPLPLVSYGGSNLVVTLASLGIAQSILVHNINPLKYE